MTLQERAEGLARTMFVGGPPDLFERAGRAQLMLLLSRGLTPQSKVLDIGCGCLRGGYWLVHFLRPGGYCGLEPNGAMLAAGLREILEPGLADEKRPRFDDNARFDASVFGERFDFFVARSIWTHASKPQVETMLDAFVAHAAPDGAFLTSYKRAILGWRDYRGREWVGRSHECDEPGIVRHSLGWIAGACRDRGLVAREARDRAFAFGHQTWLEIRRRPPAPA